MALIEVGGCVYDEAQLGLFRGYDDLEGRFGSLGGLVERLALDTWEREYADRLRTNH